MIYFSSHRFLRREKEIAESQFEVAQAESTRLQQKCEHMEKQLEEAQQNLSGEREKAQVRGKDIARGIGQRPPFIIMVAIKYQRSDDNYVFVLFFTFLLNLRKVDATIPSQWKHNAFCRANLHVVFIARNVVHIMSVVYAMVTGKFSPVLLKPDLNVHESRKQHAIILREKQKPSRLTRS